MYIFAIKYESSTGAQKKVSCLQFMLRMETDLKLMARGNSISGQIKKACDWNEKKGLTYKWKKEVHCSGLGENIFIPWSIMKNTFIEIATTILWILNIETKRIIKGSWLPVSFFIVSSLFTKATSYMLKWNNQSTL